MADSTKSLVASVTVVLPDGNPDWRKDDSVFLQTVAPGTGRYISVVAAERLRDDLSHALRRLGRHD
jgi:hypothetical protein